MRLFFLSIIFSMPLFCMDHLTNEYPELISFFASQEFKNCSDGCELEFFYEENLTTGFALLCKGIGTNGIVDKMKLNLFWIDKKVFTAQEIKFIICHELGHKNDKNMLAKLLLAEVGFLASNASVASVMVYASVLKKWNLAVKLVVMFPLVFCLGSLLKAKISRASETFADGYAIKITKNKEAAFSAFQKRRLLYQEKRYAYSFLNAIKNLFEDHPTEEIRSEHIRNFVL